MPYPNGPTVLYRFYDFEGTLLYVGISHSAMRWQAHTKTIWWEEAVSVELEHFVSRYAAQTAEWDAIQRERPRHNIAGNTGPDGRPVLRDWVATKAQREAGDALLEILR